MNPLISRIITIREFLTKEKLNVWYSEDNNDSEKPDVYTMNQYRRYVIPGYQRELQWGPNNIQTLIDDVKKKSKFLGNIFISSSDRTEFYIMDGQQRLTAILMILERIRQCKMVENSDYVGFENRTYKYFFEALKRDFKVEDIDGYDGSDYLKQKDTFLDLWSTVKSNVDKLKQDDEAMYKLEKHLLDCDINLIIAHYNKNKQEDRELCVDYFIDINNKAEKLGPADILKAYAFKEQFENAAMSWENIQKTSFELGIYYPKETMFLHYMLCTVNKVVKCNIKKISEEYKLLDSIKLNGIEYSKGTDVELLIKSPNYYRDMFSAVSGFQELCKIIINDKNSPSEMFRKQLNFPNEYNCKYDTLYCFFKIFSDIIKCSDLVPKLLLMKYYLEVIICPTATEDDYKSLYYINLLATCFSAGNGNKKQTKEFAPIALADNWREKLEKKTIDVATTFGKRVKLNKEIKDNGKSTETSGQYMSQRINALMYSCQVKNLKLKMNPSNYRKFRETNTFNDEHFFIHQKYKIKAEYKDTVFSVEYPNSCSRKISFLCNYLRMDKDINRDIEDYFILKKIDMVDQAIKSKTKVFADQNSERIFEAAKREFKKGQCPTEEAINNCNTFEEAKKMLSDYYSNSFEKEYMEFAKSIELPSTL